MSGDLKLNLFDRKGPLAETALVERSVGRNDPRLLVLAVKDSLRRPNNRAFQETPLSKRERPKTETDQTADNLDLPFPATDTPART